MWLVCCLASLVCCLASLVCILLKLCKRLRMDTSPGGGSSPAPLEVQKCDKTHGCTNDDRQKAAPEERLQGDEQLECWLRSHARKNIKQSKRCSHSIHSMKTKFLYIYTGRKSPTAARIYWYFRRNSSLTPHAMIVLLKNYWEFRNSLSGRSAVFDPPLTPNEASTFNSFFVVLLRRCQCITKKRNTPHSLRRATHLL